MNNNKICWACSLDALGLFEKPNQAIEDGLVRLNTPIHALSKITAYEFKRSEAKLDDGRVLWLWEKTGKMVTVDPIVWTKQHRPDWLNAK